MVPDGDISGTMHHCGLSGVSEAPNKPRAEGIALGGSVCACGSRHLGGGSGQGSGRPGSIPEIAGAAEIGEASGSLAAAFLTSLFGLPEAEPVNGGPWPACPLLWEYCSQQPRQAVGGSSCRCCVT